MKVPESLWATWRKRGVCLLVYSHISLPRVPGYRCSTDVSYSPRNQVSHSPRNQVTQNITKTPLLRGCHRARGFNPLAHNMFKTDNPSTPKVSFTFHTIHGLFLVVTGIHLPDFTLIHPLEFSQTIFFYLLVKVFLLPQDTKLACILCRVNLDLTRFPGCYLQKMRHLIWQTQPPFHPFETPPGSCCGGLLTVTLVKILLLPIGVTLVPLLFKPVNAK